MESPSRTYSHYKFHINITLALHVIISQFKKCLSFEVEAVKKAFATLAAKYNQPDAQLRLTFVVVGKRHHTRFYLKDEHQSYGGGRGFDGRDRPVNGYVKPGLLVTKDLTTPHSYNFYLQ
jgi:eukaryotic translation initiation factor 2C